MECQISGKKFLLMHLSGVISPEENTILQGYASILEWLCSVPIPADQFTLLPPTEADELGAMDEMDINELYGELFHPTVENASQCPHPVAEPSPMSSANVESSAANKQPVRVVPLNFEAASPTKLPEWLLKPKALEEPTHQLCTLEVQDFTAKRVKLLYLDTGAKLDDSKHTTVMQNTKSTVEPVNKPVSNENTAPKVPPHVVEPQRKNQPAMKSNNENIEPSTAQKDCKTLVSEKLWNHFYKLSTITVPVLGIAATKCRRKQTVVSYTNQTEPTAVKSEEMVDTVASVREPTGTIMKLKDSNRGAAEQHPAQRNVAIAIVSSSAQNKHQNVGRSQRKGTRKRKQKRRIVGKK